MVTSPGRPRAARRALLLVSLGAAAAAGALALVVAVLVGYHFATHGRTPPIRDSAGREVPGSAASLERVALGGVPQSILIRGRSPRNPVVLFLHGGPGLPAVCLSHAWQRTLEDDFVVVQWDRRGVGKSYFGDIPSRYLTVRRLLDDTYELVNFLRGRFGQDRLILVGHSWGTYLGMLAVRERPEMFRAYVGVGQLSGSGRGDTALQRARLEFVRREAARRGEAEAERELGRQGGEAVSEWVVRFGGELRGAGSWWPLARVMLASPECTLADVYGAVKGAELYRRSLVYDVPSDTLDVDVTRVEVPVYFVAGRQDYVVPSELAERYFSVLRAPRKAWFWFEGSAHYAFLEEPVRFAQVMRQVAAETAPGQAR